MINKQPKKNKQINNIQILKHLDNTLREKCPITEIFLVRIFRAFGLNTNAGKYGPEKTPYLDTFLAVTITESCQDVIEIKNI